MTHAEVKNVNVWYNSLQALNNISIAFEANAVTALIGPSGCGKTTFLKLFNRMNDLVPSFRMDGTVLVDGRNVYSKGLRIDEIRKNVGMVFQKPNPFPKSVFENVAYGLRVNGINNKNTVDERVEKSLRQAALWDEVKDTLQKSALELSGGQQQRLCIARALAIEPKLILMDEPTSSLDPISTSRIEDLIFELKKSFTILIVTHNLQQAGRVSDYTAFLYMGQLVEMDTTQKIFLNPQQERTQNYITGRFG